MGYSIVEARAAEGKRKAQKVESPKILKRLPENKMTFQELTDWYTELPKVKLKKYYPSLKFYLAAFNKEFGKKTIINISSTDMGNYQAIMSEAGLSPSYIDHHIGAAKTVIYEAFNDKKVSSDTVMTFKSVKKLLKRNSNRRDRVLTVEEFDNLLQYVPKHTLAILATAFYTGMRKGEILSLKWVQVNLDTRMIHLKAEQTKDKEKRDIFVHNDLLEILQSISQSGNGDDFVFTYRGKPVYDLRAGIIEGCKKAGIPYGRFTENGFTFHDLRHTFVTMMRKSGAATSVRMKITGHGTLEMDNRYDSVDSDDMEAAFNAHDKFLKNNRAKIANGSGNPVHPA